MDVHIVPGRSAAACLQEGLALAPDLVLIHHDFLSCGPLKLLDSLEEWQNLRQVYLRSLDSENPFAFPEQDRDLLLNRERLRSAGTITLWLGTGLDEQLLLVFVVALLRRLSVDAAKCGVVQFSRDRNSEIVGIAILDPVQFKEHPSPTTLDQAFTREALAAWDAVTASEPEALLSFLTGTGHALPFLQRSLNALLYHYPDAKTGLNAWEYQLLHYVCEVGPKATRVVGYTMAHDMEFPEWMADSYLFQRLHRLADGALPKPLLTLTGDTRRLRETAVHLTPAGEAVLAGEANAVEWNGIDDWVGGVHLDSRAGRVWYRRGRTLVR